ncbi:MAG: FGGY-family carbohydrate kinase [Actinomycetota bacterium]|nr:FGGY-family carbohydrate kinase [Actinomycetota bacterium]
MSHAQGGEAQSGTDPARVVAVDLGATSVRVCVVDLDDPAAEPHELHRVRHTPSMRDGHLRWELPTILGAVDEGITRALDEGPVASIGVDTWAVDYGLLDATGALVADPIAYRDHRTDSWEKVADRFGRRELYERNGLQQVAFNTIFQLAAHDPAELARTAHLLMLPELVVHHLTGTRHQELTSMGSSGLLDVRDRTWAWDLIDELELPRHLFGEISPPGTVAGVHRGVPVHLVAGHDTASAVAATPSGARPGAAFVATGTWLLVGTVVDRPITTDAAFAANYTNEIAADGRIRFLRNVAGFWLVEEMRRGWGDPPITELFDAAEATTADVPIVDTTDPRFLAPADMETELRAAAGLGPDADRGVLVRCAVESMAATAADVLADIGSTTGEPVREVHLVGGGARVPLFRDALARRLGFDPGVGAVEAAAAGNALVQGVALGHWPDLATAQQALLDGS